MAAALRVCYLAGLSHTAGFSQPAVDAGYHDAWARGLAYGEWHYSPQHDVAAMRTAPYFRPPGYPFFLAGVYRLAGANPLTPRIVQFVLGLLSLWILGGFARRVWGAQVAWITQLIAGCYWGLIYFEGELLEPSLLVLGAVACVAALQRAAAAERRGNAIAWAGAAGLALGVHALTRPNILLVAPVLAVWLAIVRSSQERLSRRAKAIPPRQPSVLLRRGARWILPASLPVLSLTLGSLLVVLPVTWRNRHVGGETVLISTNGGVNLYIGNHDGADGLFVGSTAEFGSFGTSSVYEDIVAGLSRQAGRKLSYREVDRHFSQKAWTWIREHPGRVLRLAGKKLVLLLSAWETGHNRVIYFDRRRLPVIRWLPGNWGLLLALGALGWGLYGPRRPGAFEGACGLRRSAGVLVVLFAGTYAASFLPFFVTGQYRMPLVPWLCLGAAMGLVRAGQAVQAQRWAALAGGLAAAVAVYLAAALNWAHLQPNAAKWHFDEGTAYEALGKSARAEASYRAAIAAGGQIGSAWYNLGRLMAARGDWSGAIEAYRAALTSGLPDKGQAYNNLGNALLRTGQQTEALSALARAVAERPEDAEIRCNYGSVLLANGRARDARDAFEAALRLSGGRLAFAHLQLGLMAWRERRVADAEQHFGAACALRPELASAVARIKSRAP